MKFGAKAPRTAEGPSQGLLWKNPRGPGGAIITETAAETAPAVIAVSRKDLSLIRDQPFDPESPFGNTRQNPFARAGRMVRIRVPPARNLSLHRALAAVCAGTGTREETG